MNINEIIKNILINIALNCKNDSSKKERIMFLWEKEIISNQETEFLIKSNNLINS